MAALAASTPGRVIAATVDVTDTASLAALAERCVAEVGRLDVWVNNAGIFPTTGPATDATDEFIDRMLEVNVRGTFAGAREAARRMSPGGVIVNVASTTGFRAAVGISAYVASKHAVVGLTKNLALELGPRGIRVVGVAPGVIDTPGVQEQLAPLKAAGLDVGATMSRHVARPRRSARRRRPHDRRARLRPRRLGRPAVSCPSTPGPWPADVASLAVSRRGRRPCRGRCRPRSCRRGRGRPRSCARRCKAPDSRYGSRSVVLHRPGKRS